MFSSPDWWKRLKNVVIGAPDDMATEMGPLCTQGQLNTAVELCAASVQAGATILTGGQPVDCAGTYFRPAIIDCTHATDAPCLT